MRTKVKEGKERSFGKPFCLQKGLLLFAVIIVTSMFTAAAAIPGTASEPPEEIGELQQLVYDHGYAYTVAENWITALSPEERQSLCGYKPSVPPAEPNLLPGNVNFQSMVGIQESGRVGQPPSYDAMALGYVTPIKNQGSCGSCWVFAATADFESDAAIGESSLLDFAEQEVGDCNIWYSVGGYSFCNGGNALMTTNYFTKSGSADETCSPYNATPQTCLNCPLQKNVDNWRMITDGNGDTQINAIKNAILNYGPVYSTIYASDPGFGAYTGGVYEYWGYDDVNHAIEIIGWNDSLQHTHGFGAWMIKNSWGTGWGASGPYPGCAWVAYGAANIGDWTSGIADYKNPGDILFYHDESGWMNWCLGYGNPTAYGAVRFTPPQDSTLTAVDFWAVDAGMQYEIRIFDTLNDLGGGSYSLSSQLGSTQTGTTYESGYYSIPLNTPVQLASGNDFIVQVKFTTTGYGYPLAIDYYDATSHPWIPPLPQVFTFSGESYQSPNGTQFVKPAEDIGIRARLVAQQQTEGWFFKANHSNYAPSGMPDFDQKQNAWQTINAGPDGIADTTANASSDDVQISPAGSSPGAYKPVVASGPDCKLDTVPAGDDSVIWSYCGPTAVANCFWWFDSKYADPNGTPGDGSDIFPLVQDYGAGDDHLAANVPSLVCDLANQMLTCSKGTTEVNDMQSAINGWLNDTELNNRLYEHTVEKPDFYWIEEEIERSQDVILLLGFWENRGTLEYPEWVRIGGHYVTCAGVNPDAQMIAFSDPYFDNAVAGGQGRIVPDPHPPGYTYTFHNDTANISHDFYTVASSPSPGGDWGIPDYPVSLYPYLVMNFQDEEYLDGPIYTEIEYAVLISPVPCTPGIEVNKTVWDPVAQAWVKVVDANVSDTVRFRLWVHNNGTCCNLTNLTVMDLMSDSLEYADTATVNGVLQEPVQTGPDEYVWNFSGPLAPCQNITIEFDALVIKCGYDTNVVNVTGWCNETVVSDEDSASVNSLCPGWYWKDYNGDEEGGYMPDFDQNQDGWQNYCAPTAEANSLWWFAQKYPDREVVPAGMTPQQLIQHLAYLMDTNGQRTGDLHEGTYVDDEQAGIDEYLAQHNLTDLLYEHTEPKPEFEWIEAEIERCQDVKLDLGFYEVIDVVYIDPWYWQIVWRRIGGHAVTAAGVNSENFQIAISDPDADNAEFGLPGVVRGPNHNHSGVPFRHPAYDHTQHNDGVSASHDIYNVAPSISPGGTWELIDAYWRDPVVAYWYYENNGGTWDNVTDYYGDIPPEIGEIHTEIEYAVVVSPKCTPGIEVNKTVWNGTAWVKEIDANVSDIIRFRLWVHNNGTCCNLTNITVTDTLSDSLNYSDNATVNGVPQEPIQTGPNEYVWNFSGPLAPCQNIAIEFDASVVKCGNDTNVVNATAWCNWTMVSDWDRADVHAPCGICGDANDDGVVDMTDVMTVWYDFADYPYSGAYTISNAWAADVNCDTYIDMTDVMTIWYDFADYPYVGAYVVNCC